VYGGKHPLNLPIHAEYQHEGLCCVALYHVIPGVQISITGIFSVQG
jgi:hypothetical protein